MSCFISLFCLSTMYSILALWCTVRGPMGSKISFTFFLIFLTPLCDSSLDNWLMIRLYDYIYDIKLFFIVDLRNLIGPFEALESWTKLKCTEFWNHTYHAARLSYSFKYISIGRFIYFIKFIKKTSNFPLSCKTSWAFLCRLFHILYFERILSFYSVSRK